MGAGAAPPMPGDLAAEVRALRCELLRAAADIARLQSEVRRLRAKRP